MKKSIYLWLCALVLTMVGLSSCIDDDEIDLGKSDENFTEECHTDSINGWAITRDESERVTYVICFLAGQDPVEKLYNNPSSFDEIKYLFPLSEGNEIRLESEGKLQPFEGLPEFGQYYEQYSQYYKGIYVLNAGARFFYFTTPEGKRLSYGWAAPFNDIKDLDTTPLLSEQNARQVLADYLKVDRDDSWDCNLCIKEFSSRENGKIVRKQRLVYFVMGPYAPGDPNVYYYRTPQYMALIDAHTGELISMQTSG